MVFNSFNGIGCGMVLFLMATLGDSLYMMAFKKPAFLHHSGTLTNVSPTAAVLERYFPFYNRLDAAHKQYFRHRVNSFMERYTFAGRGIAVTEEMEVSLAATWVMLTFGMRKYLPDLFSVIVLYPDTFTAADGEERQCEFNPMAKAVVFSWPYFKEGMVLSNDNFNPGLYQFARIMHFWYRLNDKADATASLYCSRYEKLLDYLDNPRNRNRIMEAGYFTEGEYYNNEQFLAIVLQYFFETPEVFKKEHHGLYKKIAIMINSYPALRPVSGTES